MNTYIAGVDAALSTIQKGRQKDIGRAVLGFLSVRFSSSTPATLSMGYNDDPSPAGGRSYLEIFSLADFYENLETYDDIVKPIQEQSIGAFLVWNISFLFWFGNSFAYSAPYLNLGTPPLGSIHDTRIQSGIV